jgi:hypothetical protein
MKENDDIMYVFTVEKMRDYLEMKRDNINDYQFLKAKTEEEKIKYQAQIDIINTLIYESEIFEN